MINFSGSIIQITNNNFYFNLSFNREDKKPTIENSNLIAKQILCGKIASLYLFPDFEFENTGIYQEKAQLALKIMRRLIREFPCKKESEVSYLVKNFGINNVSNNEEFYSQLLNMEFNMHNHLDDSIFLLGLRSISAILCWNIHTASLETINEIINEIKPIANNFKRKELLFN